MPPAKAKVGVTAADRSKVPKKPSQSSGLSRGKTAKTAASDINCEAVAASATAAAAATAATDGSGGSGSGNPRSNSTARRRTSGPPAKSKPRHFSSKSVRAANSRKLRNFTSSGWQPITPKSFESVRSQRNPVRAAGRTFSSDSSHTSSSTMSMMLSTGSGMRAGLSQAHAPSPSYVAFLVADSDAGSVQENDNGSDDRDPDSVTHTGGDPGAAVAVASAITATSGTATTDAEVQLTKERGANEADSRFTTSSPTCVSHRTLSGATGLLSTAAAVTASGRELWGDGNRGAKSSLSPQPTDPAIITTDGIAVHALLEGMVRRASRHAQSSSGMRARARAARSIAAIHNELQEIQRACGFGLSQDYEVARRAAEWGVGLLGPWMTNAASVEGFAAVTAGSGGVSGVESTGTTVQCCRGPQRSLDHFSAATLLRIMGYCDLASLATLAHTNARISVLTQHEGLWLHLAYAYGVTATVDPSLLGDGARATVVKDALRRALAHDERRDEADAAHLQEELTKLEQRMAARTEANYRDTINVDRTLSLHNPSAILSGNFSKQVVRRLPNGGVAGDEKDSPSAEKYRLMVRQLQELENARRTMESDIAANVKSLAGQQAAIEELIARTEMVLGQGLGMSTMTRNEKDLTKQLVPDHTTASTGFNASSAAAVVGGQPFVSYAEVSGFERRMVRLVLNGGYNSNTAVGDAREKEISVVLRRGVSDFGTLELLLMQWERASGIVAGSRVDDGPAKRAVRARWKAFGAFFPLNDDFYVARQYLQDCEANANAGSTPGSADAPVSAVLKRPATAVGGNVTVRGPSRKIESILLRLTGIVRKVSAMKDDEVLQVIM